jgi:hypothetical protein
MPWYVSALSQSRQDRVVEEPVLERLLPWKSIGMPGEVSTSADPSSARFLANRRPGITGRDGLRDADQAIGDLVVRLV